MQKATRVAAVGSAVMVGLHGFHHPLKPLIFFVNKLFFHALNLSLAYCEGELNPSRCPRSQRLLWLAVISDTSYALHQCGMYEYNLLTNFC